MEDMWLIAEKSVNGYFQKLKIKSYELIEIKVFR